MTGRFTPWRFLLLGLVIGLGCVSTPAEPESPAWADVAPIFRGECNGCHGWNAGQTGGGYQFDFFDVTKDVCGDAALALNKGVVLAGSPFATPLIKTDVVKQAGVSWPRMPPQPSPALPDWERNAIERWATEPVGAQPVKGPPPPGNRPPTIAISGYPSTAGATLAFTAVIDDPDGDSALGVIETPDFAFLMNRPGSFNVSFDTSGWSTGRVSLQAVLCDGWTSTTIDLGAIQIVH